jgi:hypothetical protein
MELHRESRRTLPVIVNLDIRWKRVVNFRPWQLYALKELVLWEACWAQSPSGRFRKQKTLLTLNSNPGRVCYYLLLYCFEEWFISLGWFCFRSIYLSQTKSFTWSKYFPKFLMYLSPWEGWSRSSFIQSRFNTLRLPFFFVPWRMHSKDAVLLTKKSQNTACVRACVKSSDASAKGFRLQAYSVSSEDGKSVLIVKVTLLKNSLYLQRL